MKSNKSYFKTSTLLVILLVGALISPSVSYAVGGNTGETKTPTYSATQAAEIEELRAQLQILLALLLELLQKAQTGLNETRIAGSAAAAKQSFGNVRTLVELYYNQNNFSYEGACTDSQVREGLLAAENAAQNEAICSADDQAWAAEIKLPDGNYWCVDWTGYVGANENPVFSEVFYECAE